VRRPPAGPANPQPLLDKDSFERPETGRRQEISASPRRGWAVTGYSRKGAKVESCRELSVAVFATDNDQRAVLQVLVDGTGVARDSV